MANNVTRPASKASDAKSFSRRFHTSDQHDKAQAAWDAKQDAVMEDVELRDEARAKRTPQEQLLILDKRPGNSRKERTRLNKAIAKLAA